MRHNLLLATVVLAACAPAMPDTAANATAVGPVARTMAAPRSVTPAAMTKPGTLKTFRDWTVGCDNGLRCTMASLGTEAGPFPAATVTLVRDAGPGGAP